MTSRFLFSQSGYFRFLNPPVWLVLGVALKLAVYFLLVSFLAWHAFSSKR
jgi:hypothetical protein